MQEFADQLNEQNTVSIGALHEQMPAREVIASSLGVATSCIEQVAPLTPMQGDLYLNYLINPDATAFSIGMVVTLGDELDIGLWRRAVTLTIEHESILRTVFLDYEDMLYQVALKDMPCHFEFIDLQEASDTTRDADTRLFDDMIKVRYELLSIYPAFRNFLVKDQQGQYKAVVACHHILCDGPAVKLFLDRVGAVYAALLQRETVDIGPGNSFYDCLAEVRAQFDTEETLDYWRARLHAVKPLPVYRGSLEPKSVSRTLLLEGEALEHIKNFCAEQSCSLPTYFRFLYCILLSKYYNVQDDFVIYSLINGRPKGYQDTLGCFYQVLPIVISGEVLQPDAHLEQLLAQVRNYRKEPGNKQHISTFAQSQILKEETVRYYYNFYNFGYVHFLGKDLPFENGDYYGINEVHLVVNDQGDRIELLLYYDQSKFIDVHFLERMLWVSQQVINGVRCPGNLNTLLPEEQDYFLRASLLPQVNSTCLDSFASIFEAQVERTPDAIAVSDDEQQVSYHQLNERANCLAGRLQAQGIHTESLVACLANRSIDFLTAILATFKAGGAYFPLNPHYPFAQLAGVLEQSKASLVLVSQEFLPTLQQALQDMPSSQSLQVCLLEDLLKEQPEEDEGRQLVTTTANNLAYVIYTSGSTGVPKGVMIEQGGMLNHLFGKISELAIVETDIIAQTASQAFDISVWQWLAGLLVGAQVHIIADQFIQDPAFLMSEVERAQVTILEVVPSLIEAMLLPFDEEEKERPRLSTLRWCISTGEALSPMLMQQWLESYPHIPLVNAYGPTECSDDVTHCFLYRVPSEVAIHTPIGHALPNICLYVLDPMMNMVPYGVPGELYVGGICVGRGYLGETAKTAAVFLPDPFHPSPGMRMYKTGDIVRFLPDGSLDYLGRSDYQVKIRGFRIEMGEIEACLRKYSDVREAVVVVHEVAPGDRRLIAYVVARLGATLMSSNLRSWMCEWLPDYSVPSAFIVLESFPLSANGKVERKALPLPNQVFAQHEETYVSASSPTEKALVNIWSQVLGVEQIGIYDKFFVLGGNSLLVLRLKSQMREVLHINISIRDLFSLSTVARLANFVDTQYSPA